jgi:hypothetical protein
MAGTSRIDAPARGEERAMPRILFPLVIVGLAQPSVVAAHHSFFGRFDTQTVT